MVVVVYACYLCLVFRYISVDYFRQVKTDTLAIRALFNVNIFIILIFVIVYLW
jgi:hypothetical protein